ncbi:uncharacterized protein A4U43_C07F20680 [Asparagus officinalis]|uniref:Uncharacterized protein n=1 Tax=Asparagus officinalis TaxID=4686 RepID=A0A5P1EIQ4_ASPOF|nr:uncharacterized protein A4U43_C07F20680 [Asparagus officinalis]
MSAIMPDGAKVTLLQRYKRSNQVPNSRVKLPYTCLVIWFTQHCSPPMSGAMPGEANIDILQRYERSKWMVKYLVGVRRILQNKNHYRRYCCFPFTDSVNLDDEFEDSMSTVDTRNSLGKVQMVELLDSGNFLRKVCQMRIEKRQEAPGRGQWKGKRPLHIPPPPQASKKQRLASPKPESMLGGSFRIREESPAVPVREPRIGSSGKEPIPLDDEEEQVDNRHDDTDVYLTEPDDAGNIDDGPDFGTVGECDGNRSFTDLSMMMTIL